MSDPNAEIPIHEQDRRSNEVIERRYTILTTMVGSHAWSMATPKSDRDMWNLQVAPLRLIKRDEANLESKMKRIPDDAHFHEASKVVKELIKGNLNFVEGVMSPKLEFATEEGHAIRRLVAENPTKGTYHSMKGMLEHNIHQHLKKGLFTPKEWGKILRAAKMGITLLETGRYEFKPVDLSGCSEKAVREALADLDVAYQNSTLPERADERPFRDWLEMVRDRYVEPLPV